MKKGKLVHRSELCKLRRRRTASDRLADTEWGVMLDNRVASLELWFDALHRAAETKPEAIHEIVLAILAEKKMDRTWA